MDDEIPTIHKSKQPRRPHHIQAWAESRNLRPVDLATELGADKGLVSRWYSGSSPGVEWQEKLAAFFETEIESLFRHPDDDWMAKFFADRGRDEVERMKQVLEAGFPRRKKT